MNRRVPGSLRIETLFEVGTVAGLSDAQLLDWFRTRPGSAAELAFESLMIRHGPMVMRVCRGVLGDVHDAQDAYQATFLVLARRARSIRDAGSLASWLHGVALRISRCDRAASQRRRFHEIRATARISSVDAPIREDDSEAILHQELSRLPDRYRLPLLLCDLRGLTHDRAADELGWPVGTVKSRLSRGRARLRVRLTRRGFSSESVISSLPIASCSGLGVSHAVMGSTSRIACEMTQGQGSLSAIPAKILLLMERSSRVTMMTKASLAGVFMILGAVGAREIPRCLPSPRGDGEQTPAMVAVVKTSHPQDEPELRASDAPSQPRERAEAGLADHWTRPRPWETAARIKVTHKTRRRVSPGDPMPLEPETISFEFASGTIIRSTEESTLIATCAHSFQLRESPQPSPSKFPNKIHVDLFDGKLISAGERHHVTAVAGSLEGELVDLDISSDVALVRIHPGRVLPVSPIAPSDRVFAVGTPMVTVGCSLGSDATVWSTKVNREARPMEIGRPTRHYEGMECLHAPQQGHSGGGLFTNEGELAGISNYAEPMGDKGLYAPTSALHRLLARNMPISGEGIGRDLSRSDESIYIPPIEVEGLRPGLKLQMTEALKRQLREGSRLKMVDDPGAADLILELRGTLRNPKAD